MAALNTVAKRLPEQIKVRFVDWHGKKFTTKGTKYTKGKRLSSGLISFATLLYFVFSRGLTYGMSCAPSGRKDQIVIIPVPFIYTQPS